MNDDDGGDCAPIRPERGAQDVVLCDTLLDTQETVPHHSTGQASRQSGASSCWVTEDAAARVILNFFRNRGHPAVRERKFLAAQRQRTIELVHKHETQRHALLVIQSWWRGCVSRSFFLREIRAKQQQLKAFWDAEDVRLAYVAPSAAIADGMARRITRFFCRVKAANDARNFKERYERQLRDSGLVITTLKCLCCNAKPSHLVESLSLFSVRFNLGGGRSSASYSMQRWLAHVHKYSSRNIRLVQRCWRKAVLRARIWRAWDIRKTTVIRGETDEAAGRASLEVVSIVCGEAIFREGVGVLFLAILNEMRFAELKEREHAKAREALSTEEARAREELLERPHRELLAAQLFLQLAAWSEQENSQRQKLQLTAAADCLALGRVVQAATLALSKRKLLCRSQELVVRIAVMDEFILTCRKGSGSTVNDTHRHPRHSLSATIDGGNAPFRELIRENDAKRLRIAETEANERSLLERELARHSLRFFTEQQPLWDAVRDHNRMLRVTLVRQLLKVPTMTPSLLEKSGAHTKSTRPQQLAPRPPVGDGGRRQRKAPRQPR